MAIIDDLRNERATAINNYYNSYNLYLTKLAEDGDNVYTPGEEDQFQAKFKAFNDLTNLYYTLLNEINGYIIDSGLPNDEGPVNTTDWWKAVNANNAKAPMYITDRDYADNINSLFIINNKDFPNKRDPYILYNQSHSNLGSFDNRSWKNTSSIGNYTETENPLAIDENYRLAEPLEWWGNTDNLIWSKILYNGYFKYRNIRLKDETFEDNQNIGFTNWHFEDNQSIDKRFEAFEDINIWPSPYEIMRYSFYGDGLNTTKPSVSNIKYSGSTYFKIQDDKAANWTIGNIYLMWNINDTNEWYYFRVLNVTVDSYDSGGTTEYETVITIDNFNEVPQDVDYPDTLTVIENPTIPGANKGSIQGDGYDKLWEWIYNNYYTEFKNAADAITNKVNDIITAIDNIVSFDYTVIEEEAGEELGLSEINTFKSDLQTWLNNWKSKINDTGSGLSYSTIDSNWLSANLDGLIDTSPGGLQNLINFSSGFDDTNRGGLLGDFISDIFSDILGDYNLGSNEEWLPSINEFTENNTGDFGGGQQIYNYLFEMIKNRIGRGDGVIFTAYGAYKTWNAKLNEINALETNMANIVSDNKYDITPVGVTATTEEDESINLEWSSVNAASSYTIEYKDGVSGSWQVLEETFGYNDPGWIPEFNNPPPPQYEIQAYTRGYQGFGLSFSSEGDNSGLSDGFIIYDFKVSIDGGTQRTIKIKGLDCQTYEALNIAIQEQLDELEIKSTAEINDNDIKIFSNSKGTSSTVELTSGSINDLFTGLSTIPDSRVDGIATFTPGKTYHFKMKTNNGYNISLGPAGDRNDKDWDSHSEFDLVNYTNDKEVNGVLGYITWEAPDNILVSGYPQDNDLIPSSSHIRIEWDPIINAEVYKVYRSTKESGGFQTIATTSNTYFIDNTPIPGVEYYYKIQAVANDNYKLYDEDGSYTTNLMSEISATPIRGKRLWVEIIADATTDSLEKLTVSWTSLTGATGYIVYKSNLKDGTYSFIEEDDGSEKIISDTEFIDLNPAEQFFEKEFESPTDGIDDYQPNTRYYFILTTNVIKQYFIESPSSGLWTAQGIVTQINNAIAEKADDVICKLIKFETPTLNHKIKLETKKIGESANINLSRGTFGKTLTDILSVSSPQSGGGALPAVEAWYKIQAVEEVEGVIVRRSEFSNKVMGKRPIDV